MQSSHEITPNAVNFIGIALSGQPCLNGQRHIGIIYKEHAGAHYKALHLASHLFLKNDNFCTKPFLWGQCPYDSINLLVMAGSCSLCAEKMANKIPYGINSEHINLDPNVGIIEISHDSDGMTCASFVMAYFKKYGYTLLDIDSWEARAEDKEWQQGIIDLLRKHPKCSKTHLEKMERNINCFRFRPEEVAAAAISANIPLKFNNASHAGNLIREELTKIQN